MLYLIDAEELGRVSATCRAVRNAVFDCPLWEVSVDVLLQAHPGYGNCWPDNESGPRRLRRVLAQAATDDAHMVERATNFQNSKLRALEALGDVVTRFKDSASFTPRVELVGAPSNPFP